MSRFLEKLSWWGPCPAHGERVGRYLYPDGLCTVHSRTPEAIRVRGDTRGVPAVPPAGGSRALPLIARGGVE